MTGAAFFLHSYRWPGYVDKKALDFYFHVRGARQPAEVARVLPHTRDIVLIETNHQLPRPLMAAMVERLHLARAVAFDYMFLDTASQLTDEEKALPFYQASLSDTKKETAILSGALKKTGNVVLSAWPEEAFEPIVMKQDAHSGSTAAAQATSPTQEKLWHYNIWNRPQDELWSSAAYRAHVEVLPDDADQIVRKVRLFENISNGVADEKKRYVPCMGLALAAARMGIPEKNVTPAMIREGYLHLGDKRIPVDADGGMYINYVGGRDVFEDETNHINYLRLFDFAEPEDFKDKIVIVGEVSLASKEINQTPFGLVPGMQIHANVLATLLSADGAPREQSPRISLLLTLFCSLLLVPPLLRLPLWGSALVAILELPLLLLLGIWVFARYNVILNLSTPLMAVILTYNFIAYYAYKQARGTLGKFIGKELVAQTLNIFSNPKLGGRVEDATAFFCDLRGYSLLAESMEPNDITRLVNQYTGALVKVVKKYKGRPIDYQGDGVFVLFERSLAGEDHAHQAVLAALDLRQVFSELAAEWVAEGAPQMSMGVGIATGTMTIGIVGAMEHMKMGAVGNAVNTAARVQTLSMVCNHDILITREVFDLVHRDFTTVSCGEHEVKGRSQPIEVFAIIEEGVETAPTRQDVATATSTGDT